MMVADQTTDKKTQNNVDFFFWEIGLFHEKLSIIAAQFDTKSPKHYVR